MQSQLRLLLVDDDPTDRVVVRRLIERLGVVRVEEATSGEEALERLRADPFDLVVCDHHLGTLDGVSVLEALRRENPRTGRILISADADFDLATDAINRAGVHAFLYKPLSVGALQAAIPSAVERARTEAPFVP